MDANSIERGLKLALPKKGVQGGLDSRHFCIRRSSEGAFYLTHSNIVIDAEMAQMCKNSELFHLICGGKNGANLIPPVTPKLIMRFPFLSCGKKSDSH